MTFAFLKIVHELRQMCAEGKGNWFLTAADGWLGQHGHKHTVGVFTTLGITEADLLSVR